MIFHKLSRRIFFIGIFLLPLLFVPVVINGFEGPKVWFFQIWVLILSISTVFAALEGKSFSTSKTLLVLVFGYFFWNLLASFLGSDPLTSFYGLFWRGEGLITLACYVSLVWVIMNIFKKREQIVFAKVIVASGFSLTLFVVLSILANHFFDWPVYKYLDRFVGTMGNPNFLGGFLAIIFPLIFVIKNNPIRVLMSVIFLVGIYLSGSRGAFLAITGALIFFIWLKVLWENKIVGLVLGGICLAMLGIWFFGWVNTVSVTNPNFASSRQRMWVRGFKALTQAPVKGYGLENFSIATSKIVYPIKYPVVGEVYVDKAHNEILEVVVASGIPGLFLWLSIFLFAAWNYYKKKNWLFLAALLIFFVKAQTNVVSVSEYTLFWSLIGFSVVY